MWLAPTTSAQRLTALAPALQAQADSLWQQIRLPLGPETSSYPRFVLVNSTEEASIYVGTDSALTPLLYTRDGGQSWHSDVSGFPTTNVAALTRDPTNPDTLFAAGEQSDINAIYRSQDGGLTWTRHATGQSSDAAIRAIAVHPITPTLVLAGDGINIYRSENGGESWSATSLMSATQGPMKQILVDVHEPQRLYAIAQYVGTFVSQDAGLTWSLSPIQADWLSIDPATPGLMYKTHCPTPDGCWASSSRDNGATWTDLTLPEFSTYFRIDVDPNNSNILYLASHHQPVYKSENRGLSWVKLDRRSDGEIISGVTVFSLVSLSPSHETQLYVVDRRKPAASYPASAWVDRRAYQRL
ncbi:MAG: hypothetical protein H0T73_14145 [Ardenticatenales bacterium]|nr:hypothetical protein [Ardenticatenales bacterium]